MTSVSEKSPKLSPWDASSRRQTWILSLSWTAADQTCCRSREVLPIRMATIHTTNLFLPWWKQKNTAYPIEFRWSELGQKSENWRNQKWTFLPPWNNKIMHHEVLAQHQSKRTCHLQRGGASGAAWWALRYLACSALSIWICCGQRIADTFEAFRV